MCLHHMILAEDKYAIKKKTFKLSPRGRESRHNEWELAPQDEKYEGKKSELDYQNNYA